MDDQTSCDHRPITSPRNPSSQGTHWDVGGISGLISRLLVDTDRGDWAEVERISRRLAVVARDCGLTVIGDVAEMAWQGVKGPAREIRMRRILIRLIAAHSYTARRRKGRRAAA